MSSQTVYLITGANRGIGLELARKCLLRPFTTVIATVRSLNTFSDKLQALPISRDSKLHIFTLSSESDTDATALVAALATEDITHIDIVIANAGQSSPPSFLPVLITPISALRCDFEANTLGPIKLFQATWPLLSLSKTPKFILMSSVLGAIKMENELGPVSALAYGVSKAAANFFVSKLHFETEEKGLIALALHPGWVKTANGQSFADSIGVEAAPMTIEDSVSGCLTQIDAATRDTTSGSFIRWDGNLIQW